MPKVDPHTYGLLMVRRTQFEQVNGYNSALNGGGQEDQDMICRLLRGAHLSLVSFWHGNSYGSRSPCPSLRLPTQKLLGKLG
jgi:predicted glycosyltransferase involved in capsule biosynthesis